MNRLRSDLLALSLTALGALALRPAAAQGFHVPDAASAPPSPTPQDAVIRKVGLVQKMDAQIPLDLTFRDETGRAVRLGQYFGQKPVMLILIQYRCRMLCSLEMNALTNSLKQMSFTVGQQFNLITLSIDSRETPELAALKKQSYIEDYGRPGAAAGWHFLVGDKASIRRLADAIGFHFTYDPATDQFAHPDGVIILTPDGKVARYFFRLEYPASEMRLALVEAGKERIGSPLDAVALLCFHYNPLTGRYDVTLMGLLRFGALLTILFLAIGVAGMKVYEIRARRRFQPGALQSEA